MAEAEAPWADRLHGAVKAMPTDDKDLAFVASLLSHALKMGGLTDRQEKYAERVLGRVGAGEAQHG